MMWATSCEPGQDSIREAIDNLGSCVAQLEASPWAFGWDQLLPIVLALAALIGVGIGVWQQHRASRSDQLWHRMAWAIDHALSADDDVKMAGLLAIERLGNENEMKKSGFKLSNIDKQLLDDVSEAALPAAPGGTA